MLFSGVLNHPNSVVNDRVSKTLNPYGHLTTTKKTGSQRVSDVSSTTNPEIRVEFRAGLFLG